jgi:hypothetical protein
LRDDVERLAKRVERLDRHGRPSSSSLPDRLHQPAH